MRRGTCWNLKPCMTTNRNGFRLRFHDLGLQRLQMEIDLAEKRQDLLRLNVQIRALFDSEAVVLKFPASDPNSDDPRTFLACDRLFDAHDFAGLVLSKVGFSEAGLCFHD